jgi:hypothetical protein
MLGQSEGGGATALTHQLRPETPRSGKDAPQALIIRYGQKAMQKSPAARNLESRFDRDPHRVCRCWDTQLLNE